MKPTLGPFSLERAVNAVEKVRQRLLRAAKVLNDAKIPYAIVGGNAVALWVSRVDESAVRNTQDVDVLIRRDDLHRTRAVLEDAGFVYRHVAGMDVFLDGPGAKPRDAVHIVFAGEKVREHEPTSNPDPDDSTDTGAFRVLSLEALVRIKLTAFRRKDQVHLLDMISVGLVDRAWLDQLAEPLLKNRLNELLDTPDG
jgi:hypothetical protein